MDDPVQFTLFPTALGACAIVWGGAGLTGVFLPGPSESATRASIARRHPAALEAAPKGAAADAVERIQALMNTGEADLDPIVIDLSNSPDFDRAVYAVAREIPPGRTMTYGEIARRVGEVSDSRRVGQALGRNPWPIVVPCHRVLGADGKAGGFSAPGAVDTKIRMLNLERARVGSEPGLFDDLPLAIRPKP